MSKTRGAIKKAKADVPVREWGRASNSERKRLVMRAIMKRGQEEENRKPRSWCLLAGELCIAPNELECNNESSNGVMGGSTSFFCQLCDNEDGTQLDKMYATIVCAEGNCSNPNCLCKAIETL